jgi:hypothetical protein
MQSAPPSPAQAGAALTTAAPDVDVAMAQTLVAFLGLGAVVGPSPDRVLLFRLGVLYPYSAALRRVYDCYADVAATFPDATPLLVGAAPDRAVALQVGDGATVALERYINALVGLHDRTAFASPSTDVSVDLARAAVQDAVTRARFEPANAGRAS